MTIFTDPRQAAAYYWYIRNSEYTVKSATDDTARISAHTRMLWQRIPSDLLHLIRQIESICNGISTRPWGIPPEQSDPIREVFNLDPEQRRTQYAKQRYQAYNDLLRHTAPITHVRGIPWYGEPNDFWICGPESIFGFEAMEDELGGHLAEHHHAYITHITFDGQLRQISDRFRTLTRPHHYPTHSNPDGTAYRVIH